MVISFSSFQCKRAQPPEIEDVIKIRERRSLRKRRIEEIRPLSSFGASLTMTKRDDVFYREYTMDYSATVPVYPSHIDPVTHKKFKMPNAPSEEDITKMLDFYGIGNKMHKCPACNYEGTVRTLLPHLNNIDRTPNVFYADESEYLGERTPKGLRVDEDKPAPEVDRPSGEVFGVSSGRRFIVVDPIRSHGWDFKQIGEWMAKEGY